MHNVLTTLQCLLEARFQSSKTELGCYLADEKVHRSFISMPFGLCVLIEYQSAKVLALPMVKMGKWIQSIPHYLLLVEQPGIKIVWANFYPCMITCALCLQHRRLNSTTTKQPNLGAILLEKNMGRSFVSLHFGLCMTVEHKLAKSLALPWDIFAVKMSRFGRRWQHLVLICRHRSVSLSQYCIDIHQGLESCDVL